MLALCKEKEVRRERGRGYSLAYDGRYVSRAQCDQTVWVKKAKIDLKGRTPLSRRRLVIVSTSENIFANLNGLEVGL